MFYLCVWSLVLLSALQTAQGRALRERSLWLCSIPALGIPKWERLNSVLDMNITAMYRVSAKCLGTNGSSGNGRSHAVDTAGHSVFLCMFKCRAIIFQVTLLLIFLFLNKKFCIEKVSFDFLFYLQMQSWASFRFCAFLRNMPSYRNRTARKFISLLPSKSEISSFANHLKLNHVITMICDAWAHPLLLQDFAHHSLPFPEVASTLWSVFYIVLWCKSFI